MFPVEVPVVDEAALSEAMAGMRQWLDHRRVEPITFRYSFTANGVLLRVDFRSETEAAEFAQAFTGRVIAVPESELARANMHDGEFRNE